MTTPDLHSWATQAISTVFGPLASLREVVPLLGQASSRKYYRLHLQDCTVATAILVQLPDNPFASDESSKEQAVQELPFCNVLHFLEAKGLPVPRMLLDGTRQGFHLLQDVGSDTMLDLMAKRPETQHPLYCQAIDLLVAFQRATHPTLSGVDHHSCIGYSRQFDSALLRWELDHFREWGLEALGHTLTPTQRQVLDATFDDIVARLVALPQVLVHRDFQSTNLMPFEGRLVLIDFQDALLGPAPYDLVALLRDSYVSLTPDQVQQYIQLYCDKAGSLPGMDSGAFEQAFHLQTLQRKLKDAGRFVFIDRVKGNPRFLKYVEPTLGFVANALHRLPEYEELRLVLASKLPAMGF